MMGWFYNDYQRICQNNADDLSKVSSKNKGTLWRMLKYISSFNVSLFEVEVIKKDLIGAALEADAENVDIKDKLGVPEKEFCDSLIQEGMKYSPVEKIIQKGKLFLWGLLWMYTLLGPLWLWREGLSLSLVIYAFVVVIVDGIGEQYIIRKSTYMDRKKRSRIKAIMGIMSFVVYFALIMTVGTQIDIMLFDGYGKQVWYVLLIVSVIAFFGGNYYWNQCSKRYDWK